ncbi:uracil-DNA glycosylase family protein [Caballeronia sp. GAWG1-5s-s]|uniref:uracil-DNA glycosylase family protein n=1 Tax=Caballeronia sp. GAWG1-5s-s TaxID=2921743 RepID=UPI002027EF60|nr:uracil-DNA glycosylase family protein [Caballeronia sp. GAWG1-5s-s]
MALDESLIEELGIGFLWVRRKAEAITAAEPLPPHASRDAAADAAKAVPQADMAVGATGSQASMPPIDASRAAAPDFADTAAARAPDAAKAAPRPEPAVAPSRSHAENTTARAEPTQTASRSDSSTPPLDAPAPVAARNATSAKPRTEPQSEFDAPPSDYPPFDAYDDLPWTDDAPSPATPVAPAVPDDVRTLDWTALEDRVTGCELCRLCERRTNAVFGVGDREADWMLIGEAPGENEDKQGEPFVGQAGKLLDNMLHALGLSRESNVYIANVIKCRPPGNRNPELDEVARCEPYLQRQVELVKPKIIVALGRFAAQSLLKSEASIASLRGRVHEYRGVPVVVTYHPAYLLRSLPDKAKAWADLCLARKTHADALAALGVEPGAGKGARG